MRKRRTLWISGAVAAASAVVVAAGSLNLAGATAGKAVDGIAAPNAAASSASSGSAVTQAQAKRTGVRFATYNVRTSHLNNGWAGDPDTKYDRDDEKRMKRVARFIKDRNLHITAVQEVRNPERSGILRHLPKNYYATGVKGRSDTALIWNADVWKRLDVGRFHVPIRGDVSRPQIWMKLQHRKTNRKIVVSSLHFAAGKRRESLRVAGAERSVKALRKAAGGLPFVIAGDINGNDSSPGRMGAYKAFKNAGLTYTRYAAEHRNGNNCDSHNGKAGHGKQECRRGRGSHIDMVWVAKVRKVGSYNLVADKKTSRTSDHNPLITQLWI